MPKAKDNDNLDALSFEQAITKLKDIVAQIEDSEIPLHDSISQYEQGMRLIGRCRTILQEAEKRIETIAEEQADLDEEDDDD